MRGARCFIGWISCAALVFAPVTPALAHQADPPGSLAVGGRQLVLNGTGVRRWLIFDVYEAALYVEQPSTQPRELLSSKQAKRMELKLFHGVSRDSLVDIIHRALQQSSASRMDSLKERLARLDGAVRDVKRGDHLSITYVPGEGTEIAQGSDAIRIEGDDFAEALFSVWLGDNPIDGRLKARLLSKR